MIRIEIPVETVSEANRTNEHWTKKSKRHKQQQFFVRLAINKYIDEIKLPCKVTLTRLSPRMLDQNENLPMAFKWVVDEISELLLPELKKTYINKQGSVKTLKGRADSDQRIMWQYKQNKSGLKGFSIEIENA